MSNSQWSGPGGPGFPQGQPPQGYQQPGYQPPQGYPQHGMPQGQPPYGQPPKSNTGLVIALVVALVLVIGGGLALVLTQRGKTVHLDAQGQPQAPGQGQQGQAQPQDQGQGQPQNNGPVPPMPKSFAGFEMMDYPQSSTKSSSSTENISFYLPTGEKDSAKTIWASHQTGKTMQDLGPLSPNGKTVGGWTCDQVTEGNQGMMACVAPAHGGLAALIGDPHQYSIEELAKIGDDFLAAWK